MGRRSGGLRTAGRLLTGARHRYPTGDALPPQDPFIRIRIVVTLLDGDGDPVARTERVVSIERSGWDGMTPGDRRDMLDQLAAEAQFETTEAEWVIDDPADFLSTHIDIEQDRQGE